MTPSIKSNSTSVEQTSVRMSLANLDESMVDSLLHVRANAPTIKPELVAVNELRAPESYARFRHMADKDAFRALMLDKLSAEWTLLYGASRADTLRAQFVTLAASLERTGALIFAELIAKMHFEELIASYDSILASQGSKSWIHSYVNLANCVDFLKNKAFNDAFLHPLLVALIAQRIGSPIRLVDARGKDAEPISVLAQDNMLHIDNTPFNDEYKIILAWERHRASGPRGQNFVFIPGTHRGARNCFIDASSGQAWSTENASIFIDEPSVQHVFDFQHRAFAINNDATQTTATAAAASAAPLVVEAHHRHKPIACVFAAGSLVHHRYRTDEGCARSCIILAFHGVDPKPKQQEQVAAAAAGGKCSLIELVLRRRDQAIATTSDEFLDALAADGAAAIAQVIDALLSSSKDPMNGVELVAPEERRLTEDELNRWKRVVTRAPTVEQLKVDKQRTGALWQAGDEVSALVEAVRASMLFDKHGPLDLILYADSREEPRKWARNQIREMRADLLTARLADWAEHMRQPEASDLLTLEQLVDISARMAAIASDEATTLPQPSACLDANETIAAKDAWRSVAQLSVDLAESIVRCETRQAFLSTCLFLFWTCDTLSRMHTHTRTKASVDEMSRTLLANYVATAVLVEMQISGEQQRVQSN